MHPILLLRNVFCWMYGSGGATSKYQFLYQQTKLNLLFKYYK